MDEAGCIDVGKAHPRLLQPQADFDKLFADAQDMLGLDRNTSHGVRHGGASQMVLDNKTRAEIRRRGRWAQEKSCRRLRHTK